MKASIIQEKIKIAREYFMRADQRRPDVLELFHEDAEIYFPKFGFGFGRNSFCEMVKGFEGVLEYIQHDYNRLNFNPSADYLIVKGTSQGKMSGTTRRTIIRGVARNRGDEPCLIACRT